MKPSREEVFDTLFSVCDKDKESPVNSQGDMVTVTVYELERFAAAIAAKAAKDAYAAGAEDNEWRVALTDAAVVSWVLSEDNENDPMKMLRDIINWNVSVALDPLVSEAAQKLIDRGAEDMRERARDKLTERYKEAYNSFESEKTDYWEGRVDEADFCEQAIRALPIAAEHSTPNQTSEASNQVEGEQG